MTEDSSAVMEAKLRTFRPWAVYIVLWVFMMFSAPFVILAFKGDGLFLAVFMGIMSFMVMPAAVKLMRTFRCPVCNNFLGLKVDQYCSVCGVKLKKD